MKIKKIIASLGIFAFSWSILSAQNATYQDAQTIVNEAQTLQEEGQYADSYQKSQEASTTIDKATMDLFHKLMDLRIQEAKTKADTAIAGAKQSGAANDAQFKAQFNQANTMYQNANASNQAAMSDTTNLTASSNNYNSALQAYNNVANQADTIKNGYLTRERGTASKAIADARAKYNASTASKAIVKGDANDQKITAAFTQADNALKTDNFANVQTSVNNALAIIAQADKSLQDAKNQAQTAINNAQTQYNGLLTSKDIMKGSDSDKNVSTILADATKALNANDPKLAMQKVADATNAMNQIKQANAVARDQNQKLIQDAKTRYNKLLTNNYITKGSENDMAISALISDAEKAYSENDQTLTKNKITDAQNMMDAIENGGPQRPQNNGNTTPGDGTIIVDETIVNIDVQNTNAMNTNNMATNMINTEGKITTLPQYYIVVRRVPLTDALWRIAGYSYIYNNPIYWDRLYQANRNILRDPENPNLILPGQRLMIPSLRGEVRQGVYDPQRQYITFEEALQLRNNTAATNTMGTNTQTMQTNQ